ncbi:MAG: TetR/AcrR family transcriptional regulator, fatty acid metabolism regulator protein [Solirubrobacteraceae bacterium]|jgi:AcrR family transcriptional regulator|nr:TetR/AcrR family transcriptional regulator, fatty acid metabolism regulator protein [Solirubrobacteraceae bacterium]
MAAARDAKPAPADKRRMILDAAVVAFAERGFHACRVSDIADEANVAYGLVYHYFRSKDEVLDTLFVERWNILLAFISETDRQPIAPRDKLHAIAAAIIDFYRHDPALMKVIIVEVMRSANTFGLRHSDKIAEAYVLIGEIVAKAQEEGTFKREVSPRFAALAFYGAIEQVLTGWIFGMLPEGDAEFEQAKASIVETICGGLDEVGGRAASARYV